ncbi:MAG: alpha-hydroxy-acid oxidizing protein, partial [Saprospiraceae bacterium]
MKKSDALDRQRSIYVQGAAGLRQKLPFDPDLLEQKAREKLSAEAFAYIAGGAGLESTLRANRSGFERHRIVPRMLRNVEQRDTGIDVFGQPWPSPFFLAPIGVLEMAHPLADLAVARAAANYEIPYVFSNQAS